MVKAVWMAMKPQLDANWIRYQNGCKGASHGKKGGAPKGNKNASKTTPKQPQNNPKTTPNENDNENDNENGERKNALTPAQLAEKYIAESTDETFIRWTKWTKETVPWVYSHIRPLTEKEFHKLLARYGSRLLATTIQELENNKKERGKYVGLYRTLINWCEVALKKQDK